MKKILIIGATSKIARRLIADLGDNYHLTLTSKSLIDSSQVLETVILDLTDEVSVENFVDQQRGKLYAGVFVFAATYEQDSDVYSRYCTQMMRDFTTNTLAPMVILRSLSYEEGGSVFLFGDAGIAHPKEHFMSYTTSKALLEQETRSLAVELAPRGVSVIAFALGPTYPENNDPKKIARYKERCLLKVADPTEGLVRLSRFLLETPNINITGTTIQYDGGAYLKRPA